jgi:type I restriction enzyme S subunit
MEDRFSEISKGWKWIKMEDIAEINPRFDIARMVKDTEVSFLPMRCVEEITGHIDLSEIRHLSEVMKGYTSFIEGDLLFAKITPCMENGKIAIAHGLKNGVGFGSTEFHVIRLYELLPRKFFFFFLIQEGIRKEAQRNMTGSAGQLRVPANYIKQLHVPLLPLPEQHRIVAKIEELFTRLGAGVEALKKVKAQLKRYRQAVLKYAFEGKLTQEWREANKDKLEPASVLLERIKEERRKGLGGKFKELPPVDTANLPDLPQGWIWTRIGEVSQKIQYGTSEKAGDDSTGIPVIRMGNIFEGKIVFDNLKYFDKEWPQLNDFLLKDGDVLFNRTNSMELVGKTAVYKKNYPEAIFASYLIRVGVNKDFNNPNLLSFFINSFYGRKYINSVVSQQVGQANVNGSKLSLMPIPLPSSIEQKTIVEEIENRFSMADEVEKIAEQTLKQSERLRQSILKTAFEGNLVPQDPADEPAEKLLERIKNEKLTQAKEGKMRFDRRKRYEQKT